MYVDGWMNASSRLEVGGSSLVHDFLPTCLFLSLLVRSTQVYTSVIIHPNKKTDEVLDYIGHEYDQALVKS